MGWHQRWMSTRETGIGVRVLTRACAGMERSVSISVSAKSVLTELHRIVVALSALSASRHLRIRSQLAGSHRRRGRPLLTSPPPDAVEPHRSPQFDPSGRARSWTGEAGRIPSGSRVKAPSSALWVKPIEPHQHRQSSQSELLPEHRPVTCGRFVEHVLISGEVSTGTRGAGRSTTGR